LGKAGFTPSARASSREADHHVFAVIPGVDRSGLVSVGLCLGGSEYGEECSNVFWVRLPANYL